MKPLSGNCTISFGLLGNDCPNHCITSLEIVDNKYIISGDTKGSIIVWSVDKGDKISLTWLFTGHSDSIQFLTKIESDNDLFVSVSKNKEMALWDCRNGHCIKFEKNIQHTHEYVKSYSYYGLSVLLCCGRYQGIYIIDSWTFRKKLSLQSQAHPNWIKSLCAFQHKQADVHVVLGLSISGAVTLWTLETLESLQPPGNNTGVVHEKIVYETESKLLELDYPISISICPDKPRFLLVLSRDVAQIYDAASWTLLCKHKCSIENGGFKHGTYVNSSFILLGMCTGENLLYKLAISTGANSYQASDTTDNTSTKSQPPCISLTQWGMLGVPSNDIGAQTIWYADSTGNNSSGPNNNGVNCSISVAVGLKQSNNSGLRIWTRVLEEKMDGTSVMVGERVDGQLGVLWRQLGSVSLRAKRPTVTVMVQEGEQIYIGLENSQIMCGSVVGSVVAGLQGKGGSAGYETVGVHGEGAVLCLLAREGGGLVWSGGADFCVRLWGREGTKWELLRELHCHGGPVVRLLEAGLLGSKTQRLIEGGLDLEGERICLSVDKTGMFCVLSEGRRCVVVSGRLSSPLASVGVSHGGLLVLGCSDGCVGIYDVLNGGCERREAGQLARDIIDSAVPVWRRSGDGVMASGGPDNAPMQIWSVGSDLDLLVMDTETIIVSLHKSLQNLSKITNTGSSSGGTPSKPPARPASRPPPPSGSKYNPHTPPSVTKRPQTPPTTPAVSAQHPLKLLQLLLSLVHPWGADEALDRTARSTLGLLQPSGGMLYTALLQQHYPKQSSVCGHLTSDTTQLQLQSSQIPHTTTVSIRLSSASTQPSPLSSVNHLLASTSLCSFISTLSDSSVVWPRSLADSSSDVPINHHHHHNQSITNIKQVACLIATSIATSLMPQLLNTCSSMTVSQLILHVLVLKYQDRCLEIREGARMLLHASIDSMTTLRLNELIHSWWWCIQTMCLSDNPTSVPTHASSATTSNSRRTSIITNNNDNSDDNDQNSNGGLTLTIINQQQYSVPGNIAVLLLGVIGSHVNNGGLVGDDTAITRGVCTKLMGWLLSNGYHNNNHPGLGRWPYWRRAAITLLSAGYIVWEPHLESASLLHKLLETVAGAKKLLDNWNQTQLLNEDQDAARSSRDALVAIAMARPKALATSLSIEVLRVQTNQASNSVSNAPHPSSNVTTTSTPGAILTGSLTNPTALTNVHSSPQLHISNSNVSMSSSNSHSSAGSTSSNTGSVAHYHSNQPALLAARHEVVHVLKLLCERKTREMHDVLPQVMDVLLACLNKLELRQYDLQQLFPPIMLFRVCSSHTGSGKVCVGTQHGYVTFYDIKIGKYSSIQGHSGRVTSIVFSPDGKQVASYSMPDNSVCVWQLSSSGLFGMGSSHTAKLVSTLKVPPVSIAETVAKEDQALLLWLEWTEPKSLSLVTSAGLVNKIKL